MSLPTYEVDESKIGIFMVEFNHTAKIDFFYPMDEEGYWVQNGAETSLKKEMRVMLHAMSAKAFISFLGESKQRFIQEIKEKEFARLNPNAEWKTFEKE